MKTLRTIDAALSKMVNWLVVSIFAVMIVCCVVQVYTRFILNDSYSWTEELARYTFIFSTMLAAAICTRNGSHASVTVLVDLLPRAPRRIAILAGHLVVCYAAAILVIYGIQMMRVTSSHLSPALRMNMSVLYLSIPLGGACIFFNTVVRIAMLFTPPEAGAASEARRGEERPR